MTIAGGRVLDNSTNKHRRKDVENIRKRLRNYIAAEAQNDRAKQLKLILETAGERGATVKDLQARTGWRDEILKKTIAENLEKNLLSKPKVFTSARTPFESLKTKTLAQIENHHRREPLARGILRETLREKIFAQVAPEIFKMTLLHLDRENKIVAEKDYIRLAAHNLELSAEEELLREKLRKNLPNRQTRSSETRRRIECCNRRHKIRCNPCAQDFQLLLNSGEIVKVSENFILPKPEIENLTIKIHAFAPVRQIV
jgi:selenocysteine-specific elongation factor